LFCSEPLQLCLFLNCYLVPEPIQLYFVHETSHLGEPLQHQGGEEFSPRIETAKSRCLKDSPSQKSISYQLSFANKKKVAKKIIRFKKTEQNKAKAKRSTCKSISLSGKPAQSAPTFFHFVPELRFSYLVLVTSSVLLLHISDCAPNKGQSVKGT
jgi:hypothetical protein